MENMCKQSTLGRILDVLVCTNRATLQALLTALAMRDAETHGHSERVVSFSLRLGRELGLDEAQMRSLELGALLHDIGKIGVPDAILRKPGKLTEEEWTRMREHPLRGRQILRGIEFLEDAARVVGQHHEKWDGSGYPFGLRGAEIDLKARIFSVVDAFDAIVSDRVYRAGQTYEEAAAELTNCSGRQFDPKVIEVFLRIPRQELMALHQRSFNNEVVAGSYGSAVGSTSSSSSRPLAAAHSTA